MLHDDGHHQLEEQPELEIDDLVHRASGQALQLHEPLLARADVLHGVDPRPDVERVYDAPAVSPRRGLLVR